MMTRRAGIGLAIALLLGLVWMQSAEAVRVTPLVSAGPGTFETTLVNGTTGSGNQGTTFNSVGNFAPGNVIYGFKLWADTAADSCALFDAATVSSTTATNAVQGTFIDDLAQDTQYRMLESDWPAPYKLVTDLSVATNGLCIVFHDPV